MIPTFEQFTLALSTTKALIRPLRCQGSLIEDLFDDGYDLFSERSFRKALVSI